MNLLHGLNWLSALAAKRARAGDDSAPDPGDMGTALGLDAAVASDDPPPPAVPRSTSPLADRVARRPRR
ncbi:MAG TPA: hypothetical protein VHQ87_18430 [Rhizobacter sp.]|jgi:hypothetical protein|nr:hypothetical protein [Rhizobacter sp.]